MLTSSVVAWVAVLEVHFGLLPALSAYPGPLVTPRWTTDVGTGKRVKLIESCRSGDRSALAEEASARPRRVERTRADRPWWNAIGTCAHSADREGHRDVVRAVPRIGPGPDLTLTVLPPPAQQGC